MLCVLTKSSLIYLSQDKSQRELIVLELKKYFDSSSLILYPSMKDTQPFGMPKEDNIKMDIKEN